MTEIPDALERREILYATPKRPPDLEALGDAYRDAGRWSDALDCYEKAGAEERIAAVRSEAIGAGDHFNLARIHRSRPLTEAQWRDALGAAERHGKLRYALEIARRLEDAQAIERVERALGVFVEEGTDGGAESGSPSGDGGSEAGAPRRG